MDKKPYILEAMEICTKCVIVYAKSPEEAQARANELHGAGDLDFMSGIDSCELKTIVNGTAIKGEVETYAAVGEVYDAPEQGAL